jgi:hypothetical protein
VDPSTIIEEQHTDRRAAILSANAKDDVASESDEDMEKDSG